MSGEAMHYDERARIENGTRLFFEHEIRLRQLSFAIGCEIAAKGLPAEGSHPGLHECFLSVEKVIDGIVAFDVRNADYQLLLARAGLTPSCTTPFDHRYEDEIVTWGRDIESMPARIKSQIEREMTNFGIRWDSLLGEAIFRAAQSMVPNYTEQIASRAIREYQERRERFVFEFAAAMLNSNAASRSAAPAAQLPWDKSTEARNKWLYESCCDSTQRKQILSELKKKIASGEPWDSIETEPGIVNAANRYATVHNLDPPPKLKPGRPKSKRARA